MDTSPPTQTQPSLDGAIWVDKGFYSILSDTVTLCTEAGKNPKGRLQRSLVRAVILHSGIMVESAANVLVWGFFSARTVEDIDKLSPLSKIDVYLECKGKGRLDRGSAAVQRAAELKRIRDRLVHPKASKRTLRADDLSTGTYKTDPSPTRHLDIPDDPNLWEHKHAKAAFSAAIDFLKLVFDTIHPGDRESVLGTLAAEITGSGIERSRVFQTELKDVRPLAKDLGLSIDFMLPDDEQLG